MVFRFRGRGCCHIPGFKIYLAAPNHGVQYFIFASNIAEFRTLIPTQKMFLTEMKLAISTKKEFEFGACVPLNDIYIVSSKGIKHGLY